MTNTLQTALNRNPRVWLKDAWGLAKPYWTSEHKNKSILLLILVIIFNLLVVFMSVMFNKWYNGFYDAIQHYDKVKFIHAIYKFTIMAFFYIAFQVFAYYFKSILEIKWRRFATKYYINKWCEKKAYYKSMFVGEISDNPDQRISADINSFIVMVLDLSLGLMNAIVSLCSFSVILWRISGSLKFTLQGHHFTIPGYMLFAAIIYAILGTYIIFKLGRPLIKLNYEQQAYEANFRFSLMRIREHAENIAFYNGETSEKENLIM
jgi:vitamin B12/bleomycin/antimicrobial peptide transport system ATP-binding/permease protein